MKREAQPGSFEKIVGELPEPGRLPSTEGYPFETVRPAREGFVEREGVKSWYAVWGEAQTMKPTHLPKGKPAAKP